MSVPSVHKVPIDSASNTGDVTTLPLPPGDMGRPLIGETIAFAQDPARFVAERRARYGDIFRTNLIGAKTIILTDADALAWIFAGEGKYLQNKWNGSTRRLLGEECTAMLVGAEHARRRALLMPHFRHSAMRAFAPEIQAISTRHFEQWVASGAITVLTAMQTLVFEIIVTLLLGDGADVDIPYLSKLFRAWTAGIATLPINLPFTTYHRALQAKERLLAAIDAIVRARRAAPEQPRDILGALLTVRDEDGHPLSHTAVVHELHNQLFAGHDTTVTVMTNLMLQLAQHPAVLAQARAEVKAAASADSLDLEALKQLAYMNAVLHESMRYLAPVSGTFRIMLRDMAYKGYRIPQGWTVRLEIAGTHTHDQIWSAPFDFDPARWLPPRQEQDNRQHSFIPFGGGPRLCLGANFAWAEMRVMLALLLRAYVWELTPGQDLRYMMVPFPRPKSGLQLTFGRGDGTP